MSLRRRNSVYNVVIQFTMSQFIYDVLIQFKRSKFNLRRRKCAIKENKKFCTYMPPYKLNIIVD